MRKLLIALVVLAVLLVTADRVALATAENQVSGKMATAYGLPSRPDVTIAGFPFLTQVLAGEYQQVDVSAASVQADGLTLRQLRVSFRGVRAPLSQLLGHGTGGVTAASAHGTALVGFADVRGLLPAGTKLSADGGKLQVSGAVDVNGVHMPVTATVALRVTSAGVQVAPTQVSVAPGISIPAGSLTSDFTFVIPVRTLPLHLTLTSVRATHAGLLIGAGARDLHFARA